MCTRASHRRSNGFRSSTWRAKCIQARRLAPFLELGFWRSLDTSGDELAQPSAVFKSLYRTAKGAGLRLKAHVGEWGGAYSVQRAVEELELDEVQHGIAAAQSTSVMKFLADNRIRLNVCPTSNVLLGRVASLAEHPIRKLYDAGVKVTVNTDDVLMFGESVSNEFLNLYRAGLFSAAELDVIRQNGLSDDLA
jgi:adenosine deaminase